MEVYDMMMCPAHTDILMEKPRSRDHQAVVSTYNMHKDIQ